MFHINKLASCVNKSFKGNQMGRCFRERLGEKNNTTLGNMTRKQLLEGRYLSLNLHNDDLGAAHVIGSQMVNVTGRPGAGWETV